MKIEKKDLPKSEVEFKIVLDEKEFESYHNKGFKKVQEVIEVDGFRKGNATEDAIVKKYGDMIILEEMANLAIQDAYIKAIDEHKISPITQPRVTITKIAKGNPLELTITVPVIPEVTLPKYKKLAQDAVKDDEKIEVTDKDIQDVLEELRKGRTHQHEHEHAHQHDHSHEGHDHAHDQIDAKLPELNDDFAKSFGENFKSIDDLKTKVGENLKLEKEQKLREKRRQRIMEKLIEETKCDLPEAVVESELNNMLAQMKADVTRFGGTWEEYLTHSKKTEDEIKQGWKEDARKRALSQLILQRIAEAEKIAPTDEEIEVELVRLLTQVQDADEERARTYLHQVLTNEKVLKFLEGEEKK
ncbi:MAG: tig, trigger factor, trigger factor [Candidatus Nomurabacteria bacterium]|nr:tig, trigger factor, trigger factor [Candidatus Nomurabacteria bacterium]